MRLAFRIPLSSPSKRESNQQLKNALTSYISGSSCPETMLLAKQPYESALSSLLASCLPTPARVQEQARVASRANSFGEEGLPALRRCFGPLHMRMRTVNSLYQMSTSLDILRPAPSPTAAQSPCESQTRDLERRAYQFAEIMIAKNFTDPAVQQLLAPDFRCQIELPGGRISVVSSREAFVSHYTKYKTTWLEGVSNVTTEIDEDTGLAKVILLLLLLDTPRANPQEAVLVQWWKKDRGTWRCYQQSGMRGGSGYGACI
ncbi:hypothetical protein BST61_g1552 [Cercospora zeina]